MSGYPSQQVAEHTSEEHSHDVDRVTSGPSAEEISNGDSRSEPKEGGAVGVEPHCGASDSGHRDEKYHSDDIGAEEPGVPVNDIKENKKAELEGRKDENNESGSDSGQAERGAGAEYQAQADVSDNPGSVDHSSAGGEESDDAEVAACGAPEASSNEATAPDSTSPATATTSSFTRAISTGNASADRSSSPLGTSLGGPKKFSAVSINKKFLSKTGREKEPASPTAAGMFAAKPSAIGTVRPSATASPGQTLSNLSFKTGKLSSSLAPKAAVSATSSGSGATVWAKPAPLPDKEPVSLGMTDLSRRRGGPSDRGSQAMAGGMGHSYDRPKKTWGQFMSEGGGSAGGGGSGGMMGRNGSGMEFPTAQEVVDGQRTAILQAQQIAQARAAHNQAILEGLDAFRGTNRDPNAHYWDEDDDDISFDQVVDFGDGTTYTIEAPKSLAMSDNLPEILNSATGIPSEDAAVSKDERFATESFDRSWPPRAGAPITIARPEPPRPELPPQRKEQVGVDLISQGQAARALFNERSNRLEGQSGSARDPPAVLSRPQIILRPDMPGRLPSSGPSGMPLRTTLGNSGFERALPPHLVSLGADRLPSGPGPIVGRGLHHDQAQPQQQAANVRPATAGDWRDRPLPPHLSAVPAFADNVSTFAASEILPVSSGRLRRPSDATGQARASSRERPHHPSHAALGLPNPSANIPEVRTNTHIAEQTRPTVPPPTILEAPPAEVVVDLEEMQKGEMHSAAERARQRRRQEEEERTAKAERARQKAKDLEERLKPAGPVAVMTMQSPVLEKTSIISAIPARQHAATQPPTEVHDGPRTVLQRPFPPPASKPSSSSVMPASLPGRDGSRPLGTEASRPLPPHMQTVAAPGSPYSARSLPPPAVAPASGAPAAITQISPTTIWSALPASATREEREGSAANDTLKGRPAVLQSTTWRKPPTGPTGPSLVAESRTVAREAAENSAPPSQRETPPESELPTGLSEGDASATALGQVSPKHPSSNVFVDPSVPVSQLTRNPGVIASSSSLEDLMAKIRVAMAAPSQIIANGLPTSKQPRLVADSVPQNTLAANSVSMPISDHAAPFDGSDASQRKVEQVASSEPIAGASESQTLDPVAPRAFLRPGDFGRTQLDLPTSPKAAWKMFVARPPKINSLPPKPRPWTPTREKVPAPPGWNMSWEPPLEQQIPSTMSRDEWLIGRSYLKGKIVYILRLPTSRSVIDSMTKRARLASNSPVALVPSMTTTSGRKIVVKLPPARKSAASQIGSVSQTANTPLSGPEAMQESFAQTTVEVQTSSPISSHTSPVLVSQPSPGPSTSLLRQRSPRKQLDSHGVMFAAGPAKTVSETAESKGSVRFMVSSELEGDNLLEEVNKMSLEGLAEGAGEDLDMPNKTLAQPKTPTSPAARSSGAAKSGPPSPNAATSAAWNIAGQFSGIGSPARGLPNREHIKNVWSQSAGAALQQGNSLIGIVDDFPSMLVNSVQDLRDVAKGPSSQPVAAVLIDGMAAEDDSPRYASISMSSQADVLRTGPPHETASATAVGMQNSSSGQSMYSTNTHTQPRPYGGHQSVSTLAGGNGSGDFAHNAYGPLPIGAIANASAFNGYAGNQPQGVWMPLNQGSGMLYPAQSAGQTRDGGNSAYNAAKSHRMASPPAAQQMLPNGFAQALEYGSQQNPAGYSAASSNDMSYMGMYSQSTGPVDSPALAYGVTRPYASHGAFSSSPASSFGPVIAPRAQHYPSHQHTSSGSIGQQSNGARTRLVPQGVEQARYGPAMLTNEGHNGRDGYAYKGIGNMPQANLAATAVRQGHARGGSGGSMRRGPW